MKVVGLVTNLGPLPSVDGRPVLHRISIEGLSFLSDPDILKGVSSGDLVSLSVVTHWKPGKRPTHFVRSCTKLE